VRTGLQQVADGVWTGPLAPGPLINLVVLDDVVVDSGLRWSARRLAELLRGREVSAHVVTHAHADHTGSTAWLCRTTGATLGMGAPDAELFEGGGDLATVRSPVGRLVARLADPQRARVDRRLREGDAVGSFRVVECPGHSPGTIALWRSADRVLVVGDAPVNRSADPTAPRWIRLPRSLHHDPDRVRVSRRRLARLEPALVVPVHGHPVRNTSAWVRAMGG
jgi:glyoxylase-like metal-dependent hydrolase (beta-lactamase superfamily II)